MPDVNGCSFATKIIETIDYDLQNEIQLVETYLRALNLDKLSQKDSEVIVKEPEEVKDSFVDSSEK